MFENQCSQQNKEKYILKSTDHWPVDIPVK